MAKLFSTLSFVFILFSFTFFCQKSGNKVNSETSNQVLAKNMKTLYIKFDNVRNTLLNPKYNFDLKKAEIIFRKSGSTFVPDLKTFLRLKPEIFLSLDSHVGEIKRLLYGLEKDLSNQKEAKRVDKLSSYYDRYRRVVAMAKQSNFSDKKIDEYLEERNSKLLEEEISFLNYSEPKFIELSKLHFDEIYQTIQFIRNSITSNSSGSKL